MEEVVTGADERDEVDAAAIASYYPNVKGSEKIALEEDIVEALRSARKEVAELSALEREVIEKAKAYGRAARAVEDHMKKCNEAGSDPAAGWQLLRDMESTQEDLMLEAVWPLIEFESNQIKK